MKALIIILAALMDVIPGGEAVLEQLQKRDSILIADQLRYQITVTGAEAGTVLALPDFQPVSNDTLTVIGGWQLDTLVRGKAIHPRNAKAAKRLLGKPFDLRASIIIAPFEEGIYQLPDIPVVRISADRSDTLVFKGVEMEVKTMPVDTATFVIHDIKGQIEYPVTFREVLPWVLGGLAAIALILFIALRELDKYRSDKYWAPEKQKAFYSGITDALKFYMDDRFGVDAPEMTTAELFDALKSDKDITPEMYSELKELFERADFVKFAKHVASDAENAAALPLAVRFVTTTYQADIEKETSGQEAAED